MLCGTVSDPSHQSHSHFIPCSICQNLGVDRRVQSFFWANPCYERLMIQENPDMALQAAAQRNPASFTHPSCSASVPDLRLFTFPDRTPHTGQGLHLSWELCRSKCPRCSPKQSRHFTLHAYGSLNISALKLLLRFCVQQGSSGSEEYLPYINTQLLIAIKNLMSIKPLSLNCVL